jgi:hypothetical protein
VTLVSRHLRFSENNHFFLHVFSQKIFAESLHIIKEIRMRDVGMRKFTRKWIPHDLSPANKVKRVADARALLQTARNDQSHNFSRIMTGDECSFYDNHESLTMFAPARDEVIPRVSAMMRLTKMMITTLARRLMNKIKD